MRRHSKKNDKNVMQTENKIELLVKKSNMNAMENELEKLSQSNPYCLEVQITLFEEQVQFSYDTSHKKSLVELRKEEVLHQLSVLQAVYHLQGLRLYYEFAMSPENIYYDLQGNIYIMHRDIISRDYTGKQDHFIEEYKSLIGYVLQKKYSYEDYLEGGQALLRKNKFLAQVADANNADEIASVLERHYEEVLYNKTTKSIEVKRSIYRRKNIFIIVSSILIIGMITLIVYLYMYRLQEQNNIVEFYGDYLVEDYVAVIDAGKNISLEHLSGRQKYVLAVAYIKCEDLTAEQKNNILDRLVPDGDERVMEYWICLGRENVEEAENIAMQCSDNEMLLYAYLKEKQLLELNTEMSGEEKGAALENLQSKIDSMAEQYTTEEDENEH